MPHTDSPVALGRFDRAGGGQGSSRAHSHRRREPPQIPPQRVERRLAEGQLEHRVAEDELELPRRRGEVGRRGAQQPGQRRIVPPERAVVGVVVLRMCDRLELAFGAAVAGEGAFPSFDGA